MELAALTSTYSKHAGTRTVTFRDGLLRVRRQDACTDSRLDTYKDNGPVSIDYAAILSALLRHANTARSTCDDDAFSALAHLYHHLCTLRDDACNQENAASLGELLLTMAPPTIASSVGKKGGGRGRRAGRRGHKAGDWGCDIPLAATRTAWQFEDSPPDATAVVCEEGSGARVVSAAE